MSALPPASAPSTPARMTFMQHLVELRRRLLWAVVGLFVATLLCLGFAPQLFEWLRTPLAIVEQDKLIVLSPLELYVTYLKLGVLAALFVGSPWCLYQLWLFVSPGLYSHEKRWVVPFIVLGTLFFVGGGLFSFYVVLPIGFKYVLAEMPQTIIPQFSVAVYFELVTNLSLAFGVVFELPLVMWILSAARIVKPAFYTKMRRYWIVVAFIIAAILTPPDPFTQTLMAIPLLAFFELGVLGAKLLYRRAESRASRLPAAVG